MFGFPSLITKVLAAEGEGGAAPSSIWPTIIMLGALLLIFYFLILRPQRKRDKEAKNMRGSLSIGDEIVTIGGICGRITKLKDETITIQSAGSTLIFLKNSVASVTKPAKTKDDEEEETPEQK